MVDGDWPRMPTSLIFDLIPEDDPRWEEIGDRLGAKIVSTVFNGEYAEIPPAKADELASYFTEQGYTVSRDDALISRLGGSE